MNKYLPRLVAFVLLLTVFSVPLNAGGPDVKKIKRGDVEIHRHSDGHMEIHASDNSIIEFNHHNIPKDFQVDYAQPGSSAKVLSRVVDEDPTKILGELNANGQLFLTNPSGIIFGENSQVNVHKLYAAAGNISDQNFLDGKKLFENLKGTVKNAGALKGTGIHLLGDKVKQFGTINVDNGTVSMSTGDSVLLGKVNGHFYAEVETSGDASADGRGISNKGSIDAGDEGTVKMSAGDKYSVAIYGSDNSSVEGENIEADGNSKGKVLVSGTVDASTTESGETGGHIELLGNKVGLTNLDVEASGPAGGGEILVGGNYHGEGPQRNANYTYLGSDVTLDANATVNGDGGKVIVWSDVNTKSYAPISATGGPEGGDGGFVEVSGKELDTSIALVNVSASVGDNGSVLFDPVDIEIQGGSADGDDDDADSTTFSDTDSGSSTELDFGDNLNGGTEPYIITESEIEGTSADFTLEARNSIQASGTFDQTDSNLNFGSNNVTLRTRNDTSLSDDTANSDSRSPGIDLTAIDGSLTTDSGGSVTIQTGHDGSSFVASDVEDAADISLPPITATGTGAVLVESNGGQISTNGNIDSGSGTITLGVSDQTDSILGTDKIVKSAGDTLSTSSTDLTLIANEMELNSTAAGEINTGTGAAGGDVFVRPADLDDGIRLGEGSVTEDDNTDQMELSPSEVQVFDTNSTNDDVVVFGSDGSNQISGQILVTSAVDATSGSTVQGDLSLVTENSNNSGSHAIHDQTDGAGGNTLTTSALAVQSDGAIDLNIESDVFAADGTSFGSTTSDLFVEEVDNGVANADAAAVDISGIDTNGDDVTGLTSEGSLEMIVTGPDDTFRQTSNNTISTTDSDIVLQADDMELNDTVDTNTSNAGGDIFVRPNNASAEVLLGAGTVADDPNGTSSLALSQAELNQLDTEGSNFVVLGEDNSGNRITGDITIQKNDVDATAAGASNLKLLTDSSDTAAGSEAINDSNDGFLMGNELAAEDLVMEADGEIDMTTSATNLAADGTTGATDSDVLINQTGDLTLTEIDGINTNAENEVILDVNSAADLNVSSSLSLDGALIASVDNHININSDVSTKGDTILRADNTVGGTGDVNVNSSITADSDDSGGGGVLLSGFNISVDSSISGDLVEEDGNTPQPPGGSTPDNTSIALLAEEGIDVSGSITSTSTAGTTDSHIVINSSADLGDVDTWEDNFSIISAGTVSTGGDNIIQSGASIEAAGALELTGTNVTINGSLTSSGTVDRSAEGYHGDEGLTISAVDDITIKRKADLDTAKALMRADFDFSSISGTDQNDLGIPNAASDGTGSVIFESSGDNALSTALPNNGNTENGAGDSATQTTTEQTTDPLDFPREVVEEAPSQSEDNLSSCSALFEGDCADLFVDEE